MIQLTRREQRLGIGVAAVLAVWGIYSLAIAPMRSRIRLLSRMIPEKQMELRELQAKSTEYLSLDRAFADVQKRMERQDPNFQLLPFLESLTERHQLKTHLVRMQQQDAPASQPGYSETVVEIGLEGVPLGRLVGFLRAMEDSAVVAQVASLHIKKQSQNNLRLDATIQIYSPKTRQDTIAANLTF